MTDKQEAAVSVQTSKRYKTEAAVLRHRAEVRRWKEKNREKKKAYMREWHARNPGKKREYAKRAAEKHPGGPPAHYAARHQRWKSARAEFVDALKNLPCADCQQRFPACCMDFDHVRGEKVGSVSFLARVERIRKDLLLEEVAKCEVVCSNCHRIRTHTRRLASAANTLLST